MNFVVGAILSCIFLINPPKAVSIAPNGIVPIILVHQKLVMNYIYVVVDPRKTHKNFVVPVKLGLKVKLNIWFVLRIWVPRLSSDEWQITVGTVVKSFLIDTNTCFFRNGPPSTPLLNDPLINIIIRKNCTLPPEISTDLLFCLQSLKCDTLPPQTFKLWQFDHFDLFFPKCPHHIFYFLFFFEKKKKEICWGGQTTLAYFVLSFFFWFFVFCFWIFLKIK